MLSVVNVYRSPHKHTYTRSDRHTQRDRQQSQHCTGASATLNDCRHVRPFSDVTAGLIPGVAGERMETWANENLKAPGTWCRRFIHGVGNMKSQSNFPRPCSCTCSACNTWKILALGYSIWAKRISAVLWVKRFEGGSSVQFAWRVRVAVHPKPKAIAEAGDPQLLLDKSNTQRVRSRKGGLWRQSPKSGDL